MSFIVKYKDILELLPWSLSFMTCLKSLADQGLLKLRYLTGMKLANTLYHTGDSAFFYSTAGFSGKMYMVYENLYFNLMFHIMQYLSDITYT